MNLIVQLILFVLGSMIFYRLGRSHAWNRIHQMYKEPDSDPEQPYTPPVVEFGPTWQGELIEGVGSQAIRGVNVKHVFGRDNKTRFNVDGWVVVMTIPELDWWGEMIPVDMPGCDPKDVVCFSIAPTSFGMGEDDDS